MLSCAGRSSPHILSCTTSRAWQLRRRSSADAHRLCNAGRRQQHGASVSFFITACRRRNWRGPAEHAVAEPNSRSPIFRGQSRPSTSVRDHPWPLAQPTFPVVPRVETLSTLGPWNPGPRDEVLRTVTSKKIKNMASPGSGADVQHCTAPAVVRARADGAPSLGLGP